MNVEISQLSEKVIDHIIQAGDASNPGEAIERMAERYVVEMEFMQRVDKKWLEDELNKGLSDQEFIEVTPEYWENLKEEVVRRLEARRGA